MKLLDIIREIKQLSKPIIIKKQPPTYYDEFEIEGNYEIVKIGSLRPMPDIIVLEIEGENLMISIKGLSNLRTIINALKAANVKFSEKSMQMQIIGGYEILVNLKKYVDII